MRFLFIFAFYCLFTPNCFPQLNQVYLETVAVHEGMVGNDDLTGFTTYRIWAELADPTDFVSSINAIAGCHPIDISTTGDFWNSAWSSGVTTTGINPAFIPVFPGLAYDSWVTIGSEDSSDPNSSGIGQIWTDPANALDASFGQANGSSFNAADGAWYTTSNSGFPTVGTDVLLAQITTNGDLSYHLNVQIFDEGDGVNGRIEYVSSGNVGCNTAIELDGSALGLVYPPLSNLPPNDQCENAIQIECGNSLAGSTVEASIDTEIDGTFCGTVVSAPGIWYRIPPVEIGSILTASTCDNTDYDTRISVFNGSCGSLQCVTGNDDAFGCSIFSSKVSWISDGEEYFVYVNGYNGATGNFILSLSCQLPECTDPGACDYNPNAEVGGGECDYSCLGCTDLNACNYDPTATIEDGSCLELDDCGECGGTGIGGCTDPEACNYNPQATCEDNSCAYIELDYLNCEGECINDSDADGVCDELEIIGCQDPSACNYDPQATDGDPAICFFATAVYDCNGNCQQDSDGDGICDQNETGICQGPECCGDGTIWNPITMQCEGFDNCAGDLNDDGAVNSGDILLFLAVYNTDCPDPCLNDQDADGICDEDEVAGCTDSLATNYDPEATDDDGSCLYFEIGVPFGGGTIAYIFEPGDIGYVEGEVHGIILANESQSTGATWGCYGALIGGTQLEIGTGGANHQIIIQNCGNTGNAAWLCHEYSAAGFSDWVLPSFGELIVLFQNKDQIGFNTEARYWSSSESTNTTAFNVDFGDGSSCVCDKLSIAHVRAIRYF